MGMLLKFHELCRAKREKHRFELKSFKLSGQLTRIQKNIASVQKMYSKKQTQLESIFKIQTEQYKQQITNYFTGGCVGGTGNSVFGNSALGGFTAGAVGGIMQGIMQAAYQQYQSSDAYQKADADKRLDENGFNQCLQGNFGSLGTAAQGMYNQIYSQANQIVQMQMQQALTQMQQMMNIAKEQAESQMEEEQDEALLPLQDKETEIDQEKTYVASRLETLKEEIQTLKQECAEEAKDAAPKFGLA